MENELKYLKREFNLYYHDGCLYNVGIMDSGAKLTKKLIEDYVKEIYNAEDAEQYIIDEFHGSYEDVFNSVK